MASDYRLTGPIFKLLLTGVTLLCAVLPGAAPSHAVTSEQAWQFLADGAASVADHNAQVLYLAARFHPSRYARCAPMRGHHAIVWEDGRSAHCSLFSTRMPDRDVAKALAEFGLEPGDNLEVDAWTRRDCGLCSPPKEHVRGPEVTVLVQFAPDAAPVPLTDIIVDEEETGMLFRFGGHLRHIPEFNSGCVVCMHSCPGGKISNARSTLREFYLNKARYSMNDVFDQYAGEDVMILLRHGKPKSGEGAAARSSP